MKRILLCILFPLVVLLWGCTSTDSDFDYKRVGIDDLVGEYKGFLISSDIKNGVGNRTEENVILNLRKGEGDEVIVLNDALRARVVSYHGNVILLRERPKDTLTRIDMRWVDRRLVFDLFVKQIDPENHNISFFNAIFDGVKVK